MSIVVPPRIKRKHKPTKRQKSLLSWLSELTSSLALGRKGDDDPYHLIYNTDVVEFLKGQRKYLSHRLTNQKLADHCAGCQTYYFCGNSRGKQPRTLIGIDVDCKRSGTLEGAMGFLAHLAETDFPGLFYEPSTHGRGAHGYFVLEKCEYGAHFINRVLLDRLSPYLNEKAKSYDVEFIEIKGTLPVIEWGDRPREIVSYTTGVQMKLPRQAAERFEDLRNTAVVTVQDLMRHPEVKTVKKSAHSDKGSISGVLVTKKHLAGLKRMGKYRRAANRLLKDEVLRCPGRVVVARDDLAIFLMLLDVFSQKMNKDGSMPWARFKSLWTILKEAGDISRVFDNKRYSRMVKLCVALGLIDVQDKTFIRPHKNEDGFCIQKGKAMKWTGSSDFYVLLEWAEGKEGGGGATLGGSIAPVLPDIDDLLITFTPLEVAPKIEYRPSAEELEPYISFFGIAA